MARGVFNRNRWKSTQGFFLRISIIAIPAPFRSFSTLCIICGLSLSLAALDRRFTRVAPGAQPADVGSVDRTGPRHARNPGERQQAPRDKVVVAWYARAMDPIRILLVDDHPIVREGYRRMYQGAIFAQKAIDAGARGFISKSSPPEEEQQSPRESAFSSCKSLISGAPGRGSGGPFANLAVGLSESRRPGRR